MSETTKRIAALESTKRILALEVAVLAVVLAMIVTVAAVRDAGTVALYATALGATALICGLEILRRAPG